MRSARCGLLVGLGLSALLVGCERHASRLDPPAAAAAAAAAPGPAAPGAAAPGAAAPGAADEISGTVAETMDAAGYTYARLDRGGSSVWVAGPQTKLAVGMKLGAMPGTLMPGFRSDTLKRTFDQIYFVNAYAVPGGAAANAPSAPAAEDLSGKVVETMNAGGYTYARVQHGDASIWLAGPQTPLAVGSTLGSMTGTLMTDFHSDTLNRTFDRIYFVNRYAPLGGTAPRSAPAAATASADPGPGEKIASVPGGKTIAEVFAAKDALAGKPVVVRGKVVKVNDDIMGRNWIHLRDGTGTAGSDDLLVTSQATAKLGDVVVARGTVATHQDFGASYRYDVILERATLEPK